MKKTITFVLLMIFCAVSVFAVVTPSSFNIAVGDAAPASDVILASDMANSLEEEGYAIPVGVTKLFSEVNAQMDKQVLLIIYEKEAVIVVGQTSPAEYIVFATKLKMILDQLGINLIGTILNSEVESDDLTLLFGESEEVTCTDSDGGNNIYESGIISGLHVGEYKTFFDYCMTSTQLNEYYCEGANIGGDWMVECPEGYVCENKEYGKYGACVKQPTDEPVVIIKEEVKCVFSGSTTTQECYTTEPDDIKCRGVDACTATVYGPKDTNKKITWKSSCGGYAYTIVDGESEYAKFDCSSSEVPVTTCKDSDSGKDYYEKGEIFLSGMGSRVDKCDGSTLLEYYCDECLKGLPCNYAKNYECPNGCRDGACIEGSSSSPILGGELIFYYMDTCPYSQMTAPVIARLTSELGISLRKVRINVFDPNEVEETGIRATPTMIYKKGDCIKENSGAKPYETLKEWILEGPCVEQADDIVEIPSEPVYLSESVKCYFENSNEKQECYSADSKGSRFSCAGVESCSVNVKGKKGEKITWKSSCGGYDYSVIDGRNNNVDFECLPSSEVEIGDIQERGFHLAYWECYDGKEDRESSYCKTASEWKRLAERACRGHCYADGSKCGVNSFSVSKECYLESVPEEEHIYVGEIDEAIEIIPEEEPEDDDLLVCKDSCPLDGKCYPFGYRKQGKYCSDSTAFDLQLEGNSDCDNNFECNSNVCVDGKCVSSGLIRRVIDWFRSLFGG